MKNFSKTEILEKFSVKNVARKNIMRYLCRCETDSVPRTASGV